MVNFDKLNSFAFFRFWDDRSLLLSFNVVLIIFVLLDRYMPLYMYSLELYPNYLRGYGYLMSVNTAMRLYEEGHHIPIIHLEDVFLTGTYRKISTCWELFIFNGFYKMFFPLWVSQSRHVLEPSRLPSVRNSSVDENPISVFLRSLCVQINLVRNNDTWCWGIFLVPRPVFGCDLQQSGV